MSQRKEIMKNGYIQLLASFSYNIHISPCKLLVEEFFSAFTSETPVKVTSPTKSIKNRRNEDISFYLL